MTVLKYGETAAREVSKRILAPVADETALALISSLDCADGATIRVGAAIWYYDAASAAAGAPGAVVVPANSPAAGRFLTDNPLGDVPANRTITATAPLTIAGTTSADLSANRTIAIDAATSGAAGSMSAADKAKLDLHPAISGLTTGQVLRATAAATVAYGALDLANGSAVTGTLPGANVAAAVAGVSAGVVTAADQTHINATPTMQVTSGTLVAGTATINSVITVATNSEVIAYPDGAITGSVNFASLQELRASRVAGAPSTGTIVIQAVGADGLIDGDAAGAFHALIFTPHA